MNTPKQYRKKPVVIEAVRCQPGLGGNCDAVARFLGIDGVPEHVDPERHEVSEREPDDQHHAATPRCESCGRFAGSLTFVGDLDERGPLHDSGWACRRCAGGAS